MKSNSIAVTQLVWIAGLGSVLLAGCGGKKEAWPPDQTTAHRDPAVVTVTTQPVAVRAVQRTVEAVGTLHGYEEVSISAKVEGRVTRIDHDVADRVKPGALLLEIDPTDYELAARQAEKALQVELAKLGLQEPPAASFDVTQIPTVVQAKLRMDNAQARFERAKSTVGATSREELQDRLTDYHVAQAELENQILLAKTGLATIAMKQESLAIASQQLQDTAVVAPTPTKPLPGIADQPQYAITERAVAEGSYVRSGVEVFQLVIEQPLKLRAPVPERYAGEIQLDQQANVFTAAYSEPFAGTVTRIDPAVDPVNRTFEVEILVSNPDRKLKPGGFAKVAILTRLNKQAATVPLEAPTSFAGVTKIFLVENGHAKEVPVKLGLQSLEWVEVTEPVLTPDAVVVTSGQSALADGTPVVIR